MFLSKHKGRLRCTGPHLMNSFSQPERCLLRHLCGCTVTGDEKHGWLGEGKWINGSLGHPGLFSQPRSPRLSSIFPPLSSLLSSWSLLFPLAIAFHTILSSCQGNESESSVSQPPHFSFVSFGLSLPLSTHSLVCNLLPPSHPMMSYVSSNGCWELTWGQMNCVLLAILRVVNCSFLPLRKVLPLFRESVSCFKNSVQPFKLIQSGSPSLYFSAKIIWCVCMRQLSCYWTCYLYP